MTNSGGRVIITISGGRAIITISGGRVIITIFAVQVIITFSVIIISAVRVIITISATSAAFYCICTLAPFRTFKAVSVTVAKILPVLSGAENAARRATSFVPRVVYLNWIVAIIPTSMTWALATWDESISVALHTL
jgi:hypothetical protein